jgi:hypothetical protein
VRSPLTLGESKFYFDGIRAAKRKLKFKKLIFFQLLEAVEGVHEAVAATPSEEPPLPPYPDFSDLSISGKPRT